MLRNSRASESRWLPALVLAALALLVLVAVAPDGHPDVVSCGRGKDLARVDPNDVVRGCAWKIKLAAGHHVGGRNNGRSSGGHGGAGGHGGRAGPGGGNDGGAGRGDGGGGYPSFPHPDWNGDFASAGCQLVGGYGGWAANESGSDHPGTATIDRTNVGEGNCSARFSIPAGSGTGRAEVQAPQLSTPVSVVWEELLYIPSEANDGPSEGSLSQTKQGSNPCFNGAVGIDHSVDSLFISTRASCSVPAVKHSLGPIPTDHWVAVKVAETFSDSGSVQAWLDPDGPGPQSYVQKVPLTNVDTLSGSGLKLRQGLYSDQGPTESHVFGGGFHLDCLAGC